MKGSEELPEPYGRMWPGVDVVEVGGRTAYVRGAEVMVPEDRATEAMERLEGARWDRDRPCPRSHARLVLEGGERDVLRAVERLRESGLPAAPNHVLVGIGAVTYAGAPRVQGGPGARVRPAGPVPDAPDLGHGDGDGVAVAVLDTGLRSDNPWLAAHLPINATSADWEEVDADGDRILDAEAGHGTFIAGLVLQIAPGARVSVVRVLDSHGLGDDATVAAGLERLGEDVGIVNLSLGGYTVDDAPPPVLAEQVRALRARGVVVVAAAGNDATDRPFWPAALRSVVAVGALDAKGRRASYSNHGAWVDVWARGSDVHSAFVDFRTEIRPEGGTATFEGWALWDGTSFAAPVVSAALAALASVQGCSPAEALRALRDDCGATGPHGCEPATKLDLERLAVLKSVALPAALL